MVASGCIHSPDGRQSIAVACNSRNTSIVDSNVSSSGEANQGFPFPAALNIRMRQAEFQSSMETILLEYMLTSLLSSVCLWCINEKAGWIHLLNNNDIEEFNVSLAAAVALCLSSTESSRGGTSPFSISILSQLR